MERPYCFYRLFCYNHAPQLMHFLTGDPAPTRTDFPATPYPLLWRYTIPFGLFLGFGLGLGLGAVAPNEFSYYVVKETLLGLLAGGIAPLGVAVAQRLVPDTPGSRRVIRRYLMYFCAGALAGLVVLAANFLFPRLRSPLDPAYLLYPLGVAGAMPLIGFFADALYAEKLEAAAQREAKERTRTIFGQYVSESIAHRILDAQESVMLQGETRNVTVLISDIRGFTRMLQDLGAEEVVLALNDYFTRMIDVIAQYDGTVNKFIGDAIVVLYNAPLAQPDANQRALDTARAMQAAMSGLNAARAAQQNSPIRIGIAIDAGEVVCGNVGSPKRLEYTAIGSPVNTAYHLASLAPADAIYLTETVYHALGTVDATLAEQVELKGGTGTLNVYAVDPRVGQPMAGA